jgi:hypothetical protein
MTFDGILQFYLTIELCGEGLDKAIVNDGRVYIPILVGAVFVGELIYDGGSDGNLNPGQISVQEVTQIQVIIIEGYDVFNSSTWYHVMRASMVEKWVGLLERIYIKAKAVITDV